MADIIISYDFGRRAEYFTSFVLSPYALTIPLRGSDDKVESDFMCIALEKKRNKFIPNLKFMFWVQTKSQSKKEFEPVIYDKQSVIKGVLKNKMPYFIAIVNTSNVPTISLFSTQERLAFCYEKPDLKPKKIIFIPGTDGSDLWKYDGTEDTVTIYLREPIFQISTDKDFGRDESIWLKLKKRLKVEYDNFIYATAGLGKYDREKVPKIDCSDKRVFFSDDRSLPKESLKTIKAALRLLEVTLIEKEKENNPKSEIVQSFKNINKFVNKKIV